VVAIDKVMAPYNWLKATLYRKEEYRLKCPRLAG